MPGVDDLILISVDDHLTEPREPFVNHLDRKHIDRAPKLVRNDQGNDVWTFGRAVIESAALAGHDVSIVSRSTRVRTADEKLDGFRTRARRAIAAGVAG